MSEFNIIKRLILKGWNFNFRVQDDSFTSIIIEAYKDDSGPRVHHGCNIYKIEEALQQIELLIDSNLTIENEKEKTSISIVKELLESMAKESLEEI